MSVDATSFAGGVPYEALCPTTGSICPAREQLVNFYSEDVDPVIAANLPAEMSPALNGAKLAIKLAEITARARATNCAGAEDGACPTRMTMDESPARKGAVTIIRKLMGRT